MVDAIGLKDLAWTSSAQQCYSDARGSVERDKSGGAAIGRGGPSLYSSLRWFCARRHRSSIRRGPRLHHAFNTACARWPRRTGARSASACATSPPGGSLRRRRKAAWSATRAASSARRSPRPIELTTEKCSGGTPDLRRHPGGAGDGRAVVGADRPRSRQLRRQPQHRSDLPSPPTRPASRGSARRCSSAKTAAARSSSPVRRPGCAAARSPTRRAWRRPVSAPADQPQPDPTGRIARDCGTKVAGELAQRCASTDLVQAFAPCQARRRQRRGDLPGERVGLPALSAAE